VWLFAEAVVIPVADFMLPICCANMSCENSRGGTAAVDNS
jgi:hypothetical protein